ncbi:MAG: DNA/RNA non-specific endonuclease [Bacteroidia bacterium]
MNKSVFLLLCLFSIQGVLFGQNWHPEAKGEVVHHQHFSLSYINDHEQAEWVAYELTSEELKGEVGRTNNYREDPTVMVGSALLSDYKRSGFDRGHLMPAGDAKFDYNAMSETFYLSNMSPQRNAFNGGIWNSLENRMRVWAGKKESLRIVTGPVLTYTEGKIGASGVSIPSFFYKIALHISDTDTSAIAFLLPHQGSNQPLRDFVVSIDSVERITGIDFYPYLPDDIEDKIEKEVHLEGFFPTKKKTKASNTIPQITAEEAEAYIDEKVLVCGTIVATKYLPESKKQITYLNFSRPFPQTPFTAVIYGENRTKFPENPEVLYLDQEVCIQGRVVAYKGRPQMVVHHPAQVKKR